MKTFELNGHEIQVRKHKWSKRMSMKLVSGKVIVTIPTFVPYSAAKLFVKQNTDWIESNLSKTSSLQWLPESADYKHDKEAARDLVDAKLDFWNAHYGYDFNQVAIRDQSTRWGSASTQKNLNFSWRILHLPEELQDYIIVHEICHLDQPNHSKKFWSLVAQTIPDYRLRRKKLKQYGLN